MLKTTTYRAYIQKFESLYDEAVEFDLIKLAFEQRLSLRFFRFDVRQLFIRQFSILGVQMLLDKITHGILIYFVPTQ